MSDDLTGLNLVELYDRMIQPEPPAAVSMFPQTAGWIWLGLALLVLAALMVWRVWAWRHATAYRRAALSALAQAGHDPAAIADVLRRTALAGYPRAQVAGLYGEDWLAFLDRTAPSGAFVSSEAGKSLAAAPYRTQAESADLAAMAEAWIKTHRQEAVR